VHCARRPVGGFRDRRLNCQIEYHLLASMPRPNLCQAQLLVHTFCTRHAITYSHCGPLSSCAHVLRRLHAVGTPLLSPAHG
jgi:hypothetical protein